MSKSHTSTARAGDMSADLKIVPGLGLVDLAGSGLPESLAGRVEGELELFAERMRHGLLAASVAVGLEVFAELLDTEVTEIAGVKGRHDPDRTAVHHGIEPSKVPMGGRLIDVAKPRVRAVDGSGEVGLETWGGTRRAGSAHRTHTGVDARRGVDAELRVGAGARRARRRRRVVLDVALVGVAPVREGQGFAHLAAGFNNRQLTELVATILYDATYHSRQATYDLRRLRRKGIIERIPHSHRYQLTGTGRRIAVLFSKAHGRVLAPDSAGSTPGCPSTSRPGHRSRRPGDNSTRPSTSSSTTR